MDKKFKGLLIDLDGTIYFKGQLIPGALDCLRSLNNENIQIRYLTNTASKPVDALVDKLHSMGVDVSAEEVFNPIKVAHAYFDKHESDTFYVLASPDIQAHFRGQRWDDVSPSFVLLGDLQDVCSYQELNRVFQFLRNGSRLIATSYSPYYINAQGETCMDTGAFVRLFESSLSITADLVAKPAPLFFQMAVESTGLEISDCLAVGDDIDTDIFGANQVGLFSVLVRTGKFDDDHVAASVVKPGETIDSIAELESLFR